jgi:NitT/TauT family transport system permease protein
MTPSTTARRLGRAAGAALFWAAVWLLAALAVGKPLILPSPTEVLVTLGKLGVTAAFWLSAGQSLLNVFIGFTVGVLVGTGAAFLTVFVGAADVVLSPALRVIRATPVASFIILALLWLGKSGVPAFSSALMVTPIVWQAVSAALRETDAGLLEMARCYRFGRLKTLRLVYLPTVRAPWGAACATGMGLAWKSGIAAEVICQVRPTIGHELYASKIYLETPALFAWTAVVICLSILLENVLARLFTARRGRSRR